VGEGDPGRLQKVEFKLEMDTTKYYLPPTSVTIDSGHVGSPSYRMLLRPRLLHPFKPPHPTLTSHLPTASRSLQTMSNPPQLATGGESDHGIPLEGKRAQLVQDVMALFQSKPTLEIFKRGWREDAIFEDPIAIATGFKQYAA
jgi:hypothetical protein